MLLLHSMASLSIRIDKPYHGPGQRKTGRLSIARTRQSRRPAHQRTLHHTRQRGLLLSARGCVCGACVCVCKSMLPDSPSPTFAAAVACRYRGPAIEPSQQALRICCRRSASVDGTRSEARWNTKIRLRCPATVGFLVGATGKRANQSNA